MNILINTAPHQPTRFVSNTNEGKVNHCLCSVHSLRSGSKEWATWATLDAWDFQPLQPFDNLGWCFRSRRRKGSEFASKRFNFQFLFQTVWTRWGNKRQGSAKGKSSVRGTHPKWAAHTQDLSSSNIYRKHIRNTYDSLSIRCLSPNTLPTYSTRNSAWSIRI